MPTAISLIEARRGSSGEQAPEIGGELAFFFVPEREPSSSVAAAMPKKGEKGMEQGQKDAKTEELMEAVRKFQEKLKRTDGAPNRSGLEEHFSANQLAALWNIFGTARGKAPPNDFERRLLKFAKNQEKK